MNTVKRIYVSLALTTLLAIPAYDAEAQQLNTEDVKSAIKEYLGPCSGTSECDVALSIAKDYLETHERRSNGLLSVKFEFYGDEDYTTLSFTNRGKLRVRYFDASRMDFTTENIDYDRERLTEIYENNFKKYGPVIFERWGYSNPGFDRYKQAVRNFAAVRAEEFMAEKASGSRDAYENF